MNNTQPCLLCKSEEFINWPYVYHFNGKQIRIIRCASCGLGMLTPMLSAEEVRSLYQSEYFERDYHCGVSAGSYTQEIDAMQQDFQPYLEYIKGFRSQGRYLEVGCAGGATLAQAKSQGYETVGVELSSTMAEWGRKQLGLDIRSGTLEEQNFTDGTFDVVYLGDVIEHLLHPKQELQEIHRILKPGGIVVFAYPMELNHLVPRFRFLLKALHQSTGKPYHLYYYTTKTLGGVLNDCGFEVVFEKEHKLRRKQPLTVYAMDSINYLLTKIGGSFGDRGFTIARVQK